VFGNSVLVTFNFNFTAAMDDKKTPSATARPPVTIATPLLMRDGTITLKNRLCKAAMTECLADPRTGRPNQKLFALYKAWGAGGAGMLITVSNTNVLFFYC